LTSRIEVVVMSQEPEDKRGLRALLRSIYRKPRNEDLFDWLDQLAGHAHEAAKLFRQFAFGDIPFPQALTQIEAIENRADEILRRINQSLSAVFRPPPETKAGISEIAEMIDSIVDLVQTAARNIDSNNLMDETEGLGEFAIILQKATVELGNAIRCLRKHQAEQEEMRRAAREMIRLEHEGDDLLAAQLKAMTRQEDEAKARGDALELAWITAVQQRRRRAYRPLEDALDVTKDIGKALRRYVLTNP
jgi:uncharacterized protein Yka (UPF0111/DUF47 family)